MTTNSRRWRLSEKSLLLLAALALPACGTNSSDGGLIGDAALDEEPGISHVHGLGVTPSDDSLYVATHYGLFRLPATGPADRVGPSMQDTMGFTITEDGEFLGSGHPDVKGMQRGDPSLLGLIESEDEGRTWSSVSLGGEVDFHALTVARGEVLGWDSTSGRLMASKDRTTWEVRSQVDLLGFVVDPTSSDVLLAATPSGVRRSEDGGRNWVALEGAPPLLVISWPESGSVWGADNAGKVYRSDNGGETWRDGGMLGALPQAFLAVADDQLWAAVGPPDGSTRIYRSVDEGATWQLRYSDSN